MTRTQPTHAIFFSLRQGAGAGTCASLVGLHDDSFLNNSFTTEIHTWKKGLLLLESSVMSPWIRYDLLTIERKIPLQIALSALLQVTAFVLFFKTIYA